MDGSTAQARRYYHHVINGGTLNERDVARMVEAMEAKDTRITELEAEVARLQAHIEATAKDTQRITTALTAEVAQLMQAIRHAHDTLYELNPGNYDHDEVCRVNDASVEVILSLAPLLGETHGKTPEWWAARAALPTSKEDL